MDVLKTVTAEFNLKDEHAANIVALLDEGNTIPFIARYRKELTGHIDDQVLREFADRLTYLRNLESRKEEVARIIEEQGKMTEEIALALEKAETMTEAEDIYRPYKQKRKTRASVAIEIPSPFLTGKIFCTVLGSFLSHFETSLRLKTSLPGNASIMRSKVSR